MREAEIGLAVPLLISHVSIKKTGLPLFKSTHSWEGLVIKASVSRLLGWPSFSAVHVFFKYSRFQVGCPAEKKCYNTLSQRVVLKLGQCIVLLLMQLSQHLVSVHSACTQGKLFQSSVSYQIKRFFDPQSKLNLSWLLFHILVEQAHDS